MIARIMAAFMLLATTATAQELRVPAELQYALLAKIMTFDRTFVPRAGTEIVIGVVFQKKVTASREAADDLTQSIARSNVKAINGVRVRVVSLEIESAAGLTEALGEKGVDIAYIMPLNSADVVDIIAAVRRTRARSFTGVPEYVGLGVCAGIGIKRSLPEIIINLTAAKAAGQDFSAQLLKLSRVV